MGGSADFSADMEPGSLRMTRIAILTACLILPCLSSTARAQDLVVTNARIIDGTGATLDRGSIVVRAGRIVAVTPNAAAPDGAPLIDAGGRTAMPGMINVHWHLLAASAAVSEAEADQYVADVTAGVLDTLLTRGVTTIMSTGDHSPSILDLRRRLAGGKVRGPRLVAVGPVFTAPDDWPTQICDGNEDCKTRLTAEVATADQARAKVREVAAAGVDALKLVYDVWIAPDVTIDDDVVAAMTEEGRAHGLRTFAHIGSVDEMLKLVALGVRGFVHSPRSPSLAAGDGVRILRELEIPVATTIANAMSPREWPRLVEPDFEPTGYPTFLQRLENIRLLWDGGVTVAFGTDAVAAPHRPGTGLFLAEVRALSRVLSNREIVATLTRNGAVFLGLEKEIGTLEPGKVADIILIDGNPLVDISDLMNVEVVIQGGRVVSDQRVR